MKKISLLLICLIFFSCWYSIKLIYQIQNNLIDTNYAVLGNINNIERLGILTNEIKEEQIKRTRNVYTVPFLIDEILKKKLFLNGIILCDKNGKIIGITPGAKELLGFSKEDPENSLKSIFDIIPIEHRESHKEYLLNEKTHSSPLMKATIGIENRRVEVSFHFLSTEETYIVHLREVS